MVGNARFTVLTDRLVRMEWSEQGQFEDRATLAIVNRELPVPAFSVSRTGEWLLIKTKALECTYDENTREACVFLPETSASENLKVVVTW